MANMISLSFKNNQSEQDIFNYVKGKTSPSAYIKDLIKKDMEGSWSKKDDSRDGKEDSKKINAKPNNTKLSSLKNMGR